MTCAAVLDSPELVGLAIVLAGAWLAFLAIVLSRVDRRYQIKRMHYTRHDAPGVKT